MPRKPGEGDRLCSEHFVLKKESDLPNSPDYVPSVYPETSAKKSSCAANASSLACFERAQWRSTTSKMERLATEREEEKNILFIQRALKAFKNDHGSYCKASTEQPCEAVEQVVVCQPGRLSSSGVEQQSLCIPKSVKLMSQGDLIAKLQNEISILKASLSEKPEFDVQMLKDNNKLTRFYTGLPTYDIFLGLVDYLKPIVKVMRSWKGSSTNIEEKQHGLQCFSNLSVANQLFSILIRLRLGLLITDVSTRFKISEATYSCMFSTWIC